MTIKETAPVAGADLKAQPASLTHASTEGTEREGDDSSGSGRSLELPDMTAIEEAKPSKTQPAPKRRLPPNRQQQKRQHILKWLVALLMAISAGIIAFIVANSFFASESEESSTTQSSNGDINSRYTRAPFGASISNDVPLASPVNSPPTNPPSLITIDMLTSQPSTRAPSILASAVPSASPVTSPPTNVLTSQPNIAAPSILATALPSASPVTSPPTNSPSLIPTDMLTTQPSTAAPSSVPSDVTLVPSEIRLPTATPSASLNPTPPLSAAPTVALINVTTFYVVGDAPYTPQEATELVVQMRDEIPADAEFVVHVGDLQPKRINETCPMAGYVAAREILRLSPVPVFVLVGDNEYNDCNNAAQALEFWRSEFQGFDSRYWNHTFNLMRQPGRLENFAFVHKKTLFFALNLVGGGVHNETEWEIRLTDQVEWTKQMILFYNETYHGVGRVVLFGHAYPKIRHNSFFVTLQQFVEDTLQNSIPMLYVHGDKHEWMYEPNFFDQKSFLRIMVTGGTKEPPLKIVVTANGEYLDPRTAFAHDRGLLNGTDGNGA